MSSTNAAPSAECVYCGMMHKSICPRIKRIEYSDHNPSMFKVVEFFAPNDYPTRQGFNQGPAYTSGLSKNGIG